MRFKCDQCGECCRHLNLSELYASLDSGNGICKYLVGNKCSIYNERPLICRVEESYYAFFSKEMSKEEYYQKNYDVCKQLKEQRKSKK